jgi:hypothetical protein
LLDRSLARQALAEGDTKQAVELAQHAVDEVTTAGPPVVLSASLGLAEAQNMDARHGDARATAESCLQIAQGMLGDLKHSYNMGRSHLELGVALAGLGDLPAGRDHLNQALEHLRACVGPDAPSTRRALQQLERFGAGQGSLPSK